MQESLNEQDGVMMEKAIPLCVKHLIIVSSRYTARQAVLRAGLVQK